MKERYQRIKNLRAAWTYRKTLSETKLGLLSQEIIQASSDINQVAGKLNRLSQHDIMFQDLSFRHLLSKTKVKEGLLDRQKALLKERFDEAKNERMCELVEGKLKIEIETQRSSSELNLILEVLVGFKKIQQ